jgi:hypothetical protein
MRGPFEDENEDEEDSRPIENKKGWPPGVASLLKSSGSQGETNWKKLAEFDGELV